jgi:hypothetical protein
MKRIQGVASNLPSTIPVKLTQSFNQLGTSEELEKYVEKQTELAINPIVDKELIRVKPESNLNINIEPRFNPTAIDGSDFKYAGFSKLQIEQVSDSLVNSMYILEYFDTPYSDKQTKISYNFAKGDKEGTSIPKYDTNGKLTSRKASIAIKGTDCKELNIIYIPSHLMSGKEEFKIYLRVSFFNAFTGERVFFNKLAGTSDTKNFLEITVNPVTKTYNLNETLRLIPLGKITNVITDELQIDKELDPKAHIRTKRGKLSELLTGNFRMEGGTKLNVKINSVTVPESKWFANGKYMIHWDYINPKDFVKISVFYEDNGYEKVLVSSMPSTGSFEYTCNNEVMGEKPNGMNDVENFIDNDGDGYNDTYQSLSARVVSIKVQLVNDEYDYAMSNTVEIFKASAPPIVWGTPTIPETWYKNNSYVIEYNLPPQMYLGQDMIEKVAVNIELEYVDALGNICKPIANTFTCLSEWNPVGSTGVTVVWANNLTLFNANYVKGYAEVKVSLYDMRFPESRFNKTVRYYNQTNSTSTTYRPYYSNGVEVPYTPANAPLAFTTLTKPVSGAIFYNERQYTYDWGSAFSGNRKVQIGYTYFNPQKKFWDFWQPNLLVTYGLDPSTQINPFLTVDADKPFLLTTATYPQQFNGNTTDGFAVVLDNDFPYGNHIYKPVKISKSNPPVATQSDLNLVDGSINVTHVPLEGYTGVTSHTNLVHMERYDITWGESNDNTFVNVSIVYTDSTGSLRVTPLNAFDKINDGLFTLFFSLYDINMNSGTIKAIIRVSDQFDNTKFIDSGLLSITMDKDWYYHEGYSRGALGLHFGHPYNYTPPPNATPAQEVAYKKGYQDGYNGVESNPPEDTTTPTEPTDPTDPTEPEVKEPTTPTWKQKAIPDPNTLVWEGPLDRNTITFDTNGVAIIENRNFESKDSTIVVADVWQPTINGKKIFFKNCNFRGAGRMVVSVGSWAYLDFYNCCFFVNPATTTAEANLRRPILMQEFRGVKIEHCYFEGTAGVQLNLDGGIVGTGAYEYIIFRYNRIKDVYGKMKETRHKAQTLQINGKDGTARPTYDIGWNETINNEDNTDCEDNYSFYNVRGSELSRMKVHNNYIQGAFYNPARVSYYTGGGIITDSPDSDADHCTAYLDIEENQLVGVGNYCIGIAGGNNVNIRRNRGVVACEFADGTRYPFWTSGIWAKDYYTVGATFANVVENNVIGVEKNDGVRNDYNNHFSPDENGNAIYAADFRNNTSISGDITKQMELTEWNIWVNKKTTNSIITGPRVFE